MENTELNKTDKLEKMKKYKMLYESIHDLLKTKTSVKYVKEKEYEIDGLKSAIKTSKTPKNLSKRVRINVKKNEYIPPVHERELNKYQLFLRTESLKPKYKNKSPKSRMKAIAEAWNLKK